MPRDSAQQSLASAIVETLSGFGTKRIFGIPGGGSSLELIEAANRAGLDVILTRTENAAAIMAAVTAELTGTPGAVFTGIGPGAASVTNGVAYAHLEKAPLVVFTDGPASSPHQAFDQNALFAPITKMQGRLRPETGVEQFAAGVRSALTPPRGPVHFDLTSGDAREVVSGGIEKAENNAPPSPGPAALEKANSLIAGAAKPVVIAGLEARYSGAPQALKRLAETLACPVLLTYKAKGVLPDSHALTAGLFTGAQAEADLLHSADLILMFGLDRIEMIPGPWSYEAPIFELTTVAETSLPAEPACCLYGSLASITDTLLPSLKPAAWKPEDVNRHKNAILRKANLRGTGQTAQTVTQALSDMAPPGARLTVDAGAHMFATLAFWQANEPFGALKSNGLSTMGYALPAAVASALQEPERKVIAITGDGGLMMCLGELVTALEHDCDITVAVINDAALSLIDIKQQRQQYASSAVRTSNVSFANCAKALGCPAWRVEAHDALEPVLEKTLATRGPSLVDVVCDCGGYGDQLAALRG